MTWYAHHLFAPGTLKVLEALGRARRLSPFLYHIKSLEGFTWSDPCDAHSVGPHGLAAIRPLGPTGGDEADWYREPILDWHFFDCQASSTTEPSLQEDGGFEPPVGLLGYVQKLSAQLSSPVMYYSCFMWGGNVEFEAAWAFTPTQHTYSTQISVSAPPKVRCIDAQGNETLISGDALRQGLSHLQIELPSPYFAPHTRRFPWAAHR